MQIQEMRNNIIRYLEKLEKDTIDELDKVEKEESEKMFDIIKSIEQTERNIESMQCKMTTLKQHGSDFQAYLALKKFEHEMTDLDKGVEVLLKEDGFSKTLLFQDETDNILKNISKLGKIFVEKTPSTFKIIAKAITLNLNYPEAFLPEIWASTICGLQPPHRKPKQS